MGTHPIFESDFDCLTENVRGRFSLLEIEFAQLECFVYDNFDRTHVIGRICETRGNNYSATRGWRNSRSWNLSISRFIFGHFRDRQTSSSWFVFLRRDSFHPFYRRIFRFDRLSRSVAYSTVVCNRKSVEYSSRHDETRRDEAAGLLRLRPVRLRSQLD